MSHRGRSKQQAIAKSQSQPMRVQAAMQAFAGPLPPPEILERYNQTLPGAADRILTMAEAQQSHRQTLEKKVVESNVGAQKLGTVLGFVIAMTTICGGIWLIHDGKSAQGLTQVLASLGSLLGVFLYSRHEQKKELKAKAEAFPPALR